MSHGVNDIDFIWIHSSRNYHFEKLCKHKTSHSFENFARTSDLVQIRFALLNVWYRVIFTTLPAEIVPLELRSSV